MAPGSYLHRLSAKRNGPVAVGTRVSSRAPRTEPYGRLSRIRLVWGFPCHGCITPFLSCFVASFFVRPAPRAFFRPDRILPSPSRTVTVTDAACMGLSLSRVHHSIFVVLCCFILCSTRAASILSSRPHITVAVAHSDGHGRRFFSAAEGLAPHQREHGGRLPVIG